MQYLGLNITVDRGIETTLKCRITDVEKVLGGMEKVFSCRVIGMNVKKRLYEGVAVPTAKYEAEIWSMVVAERTKLKVIEMDE